VLKSVKGLKVLIFHVLLGIVSKGISNKLLKASAKRRRSKAQIEEEKQQALM